MNAPLREAAVTDPEWAKKEHRREWLIKVITAGVLIALAVGVVTIFQNRNQDTQIRNITRKVDSACATNAGGRKCQAIKRESDEEQTLADACVQIRKVGYPCPRPGSDVAKQADSVGAVHGGNGGTALTEDGSSLGPPAATGGRGGVSPQGGAKPHPDPTRPPHHPEHKPSATEPPPALATPPPTTAPSAAPAVEPEPGNSGETPAADHSEGTKACVELVVSACAEVPKLLP